MTKGKSDALSLGESIHKDIEQRITRKSVFIGTTSAPPLRDENGQRRYWNLATGRQVGIGMSLAKLSELLSSMPEPPDKELVRGLDDQWYMIQSRVREATKPLIFLGTPSSTPNQLLKLFRDRDGEADHLAQHILDRQHAGLLPLHFEAPALAAHLLKLGQKTDVFLKAIEDVYLGGRTDLPLKLPELGPYAAPAEPPAVQWRKLGELCLRLALYVRERFPDG